MNRIKQYVFQIRFYDADSELVGELERTIKISDWELAYDRAEMIAFDMLDEFQAERFEITE